MNNIRKILRSYIRNNKDPKSVFLELRKLNYNKYFLYKTMYKSFLLFVFCDSFCYAIPSYDVNSVHFSNEMKQESRHLLKSGNIKAFYLFQFINSLEEK